MNNWGWPTESDLRPAGSVSPVPSLRLPRPVPSSPLAPRAALAEGAVVAGAVVAVVVVAVAAVVVAAVVVAADTAELSHFFLALPCFFVIRAVLSQRMFSTRRDGCRYMLVV